MLLTDIDIKVEILKARLLETGLFLTAPRELVYRVLLESKDHPTADGLWEKIQEHSSRISRMSVFRTLDLLTEMGLIRLLEHPGSAARYDGTMEPHFHLICSQCHRVIDWTTDEPTPPLPETAPPAQFKIREVAVIFSGLCEKCQ